jgi:hypothetical protein
VFVGEWLVFPGSKAFFDGNIHNSHLYRIPHFGLRQKVMREHAFMGKFLTRHFILNRTFIVPLHPAECMQKKIFLLGGLVLVLLVAGCTTLAPSSSPLQTIYT